MSYHTIWGTLVNTVNPVCHPPTSTSNPAFQLPSREVAWAVSMTKNYLHRKVFCRSCACTAMLLFLLPTTKGDEAGVPSNHASDYLVSVWQTDDGLPQNEVTSLAQTPEGYLWIGLLHGGLARFDGSRFAQFTPFNTPELRAIEVQQIGVDSRGVLWIGPSDGSLTTWRGGEFQLQRPPQRDGGLRLQSVVISESNRVVLAAFNHTLLVGRPGVNPTNWTALRTPPACPIPSYSVDRQGAIWYRTKQNGVCRLDHENFAEIATENVPQLRSVTAVCADATGHIVVGTTTGMVSWVDGTFQDCTPTNGPVPLNVRRMVCARDGGQWVLERGWIRKCVGRQWTVAANLSRDQFRPRGGQMFADAEGGVWLLSDGEAVWHVSATGRVAKFTESEGLPSTHITAWLQDREGNVWLGTAGKGIVRIRKRLFHLPNASKPSSFVVRSVAEDKTGALWVGTAAGEFLSLRGEDWIPLDLRSLCPLPMTDAVLCPDHENRLWMATMQGGVVVKEGDQLRRPFPAGAAGPGARILYPDHQNRVWLGSEYGLFCWQASGLRAFTPEEIGSPCHVTGIGEDADGAIWITTAGCSLFRFAGNALTRFRSASNPTTSRFWCVLPDQGGVVWIGTLGGGLVRFQSGKFDRLTVEGGLPDNNIGQLMDDRQGNLWARSRAGVFRVEKRQVSDFIRGVRQNIACEVFDRSDGLPTVECSGGLQPSCWQSAEGRLWFATIKGAVWVNPKDVQSTRLSPTIAMDEVWVDGKLINPTRMAADRASLATRTAKFTTPTSLLIQPGQHYLDIHFIGINHSSPEKVRYRWQMEGVDTEWRSGRNRNATYSALPHGKYVFHVQASNGSGVWGPAEARLSVVVLPHVWQTWWFQGLLGLSVMALLWGAHALRITRLREIERLRLRLARDLHDEVGAKLGAIALLGELIEGESGSADGTKVRQLALQTIDALRDIVWFIDPTFERLSDLVQRIEIVAKSLLPGFELKLQQTGDFDSTHLPLAFRRNVIPLLKESLRNITKHSGATRVEIHVQRRKGSFELSIADNGQGFDPAAPTWGNGLRNIRQRAAAMHAALDVQSTSGVGTRVTLTAPIP
jgi:ligand-binding sensor domain-containing protein/signal transduction histidine kinase